MIYGPPKTGKTLLAATIIRDPSIKQVFWFDNENGIEVVVKSGEFTDEELSKIIYIRLEDVRERPIAAETVLQAFTCGKGNTVRICQTCGKVDCKDHTGGFVDFGLLNYGYDTAVVLDSFSQLADSVLYYEKLILDYKYLKQYYADWTLEMAAINTAIQAAACMVIAVSHTLNIYKEVRISKTVTDLQLQKTVPLCGSGNYSSRFGKYFGWQIITDLRDGKYLKGSSATFMSKAESGNRAGLKVEDYPEFDLTYIRKPKEELPEIQAPKGPSLKLRKT